MCSIELSDKVFKPGNKRHRGKSKNRLCRKIHMHPKIKNAWLKRKDHAK